MKLPPLTVCLNTNTVTDGAATVKLRATAAEMLHILNEAGGEMVAYDDCASGIWGQVEWPDSYHVRLSHVVARIRKKIARLGYGVLAADGGYALLPIQEAERMQRRPGGQAPIKLTPIQVRRLRHLVLWQAPDEDIAESFGIATDSVHRIIKRHLPEMIGARGYVSREALV